MEREDQMTEHLAPIHLQRQPHTPYSVDRTLRLRRLEVQLQVLADAVRVLANNPMDPTDRTLADTIRKMLDDSQL
jgi:hypothetical protein